MFAHAMLLFASLLTRLDDPATPDSIKGLAELQGVWKVGAVTSNGSAARPEEAARFTVVVRGDQFLVRDGDEVCGEATLVPVSAGPPLAVDFVYAEGPHKGKVLPGIYERRGAQLTICRQSRPGGPRPSAFASPAGSRLLLYVLKREGD
jgi:uncharacterized protein (TIGR03067 family)